MTRFLRWGYILPRLAVLLLLVALSEFGSGVLLKYAAIQSGQSAIGAKVEIGSSNASLLRTHARLGQIAVTDPRDPMTNLLEADALMLDFDSAAALRKKGVVRQGELSGLRFGTRRETSGELPIEEQNESKDSGGFSLSSLAGSQFTQNWLDDVQQRFAADLQLESVRLAKELRVKWPAEYQALETRANEIRDEIKQLTTQVKVARENPLRNVDFLKSVPNRVAGLKNELASLEQRLKALPDEIRADRAAVLAARRLDEQKLRERLSPGAMDANSLSTYLLGDQIAGPVNELVGWLRWARRLAPSAGAEQAQRGRGVDVQFAGCRRTPDLLIESLKLSGATRLAGQPLEFTGNLTSLTTQPRVHGKPMLLSLTTTGAAPIEVRATVDRTGDLPVDELVADCPTLSLPMMQLGKPESLGLTVAPSTAALSLSLTLTGEKIAGELQLVQRNVRVTPHVKQSLGDVLDDANLERALASRLSQTPQLVTSVSLSGELDDPQFKLWSTTGPALAEAMEDALKNFAAEKTQSLLAKGQEAVADELAALDREVDQLSTQVTAALGEPAKALSSIVGGGNNIGAIGSRLAPVGSLFK